MNHRVFILLESHIWGRQFVCIDEVMLMGKQTPWTFGVPFFTWQSGVSCKCVEINILSNWASDEVRVSNIQANRHLRHVSFLAINKCTDTTHVNDGGNAIIRPSSLRLSWTPYNIFTRLTSISSSNNQYTFRKIEKSIFKSSNSLQQEEEEENPCRTDKQTLTDPLVSRRIPPARIFLLVRSWRFTTLPPDRTTYAIWLMGWI